MKLLALLPLVAITLGTTLLAADKKTELEGTWEMTAFEKNGKKTRPEQSRVATITGNKFVLKAGDKVIVAGTMTLDPTKTPKQVDATYTEGPEKGKTVKGIYQLDGNVLKFCNAGGADAARPDAFTSKDGAFISVYKRVKR